MPKIAKILFSAMLATGSTMSPTICSAIDAVVAWGRQDRGIYNLYLSRNFKEFWSEPEQVSYTSNQSILPAVGFNDKEEIWLVWTELTAEGSHLEFLYYPTEGPNKSGVIETDTHFDIAPTLLILPNGFPIVAWSAYDGTDDEIYFTSWTAEGWLKPILVNHDNTVPDILPSLFSNENGELSIAWYSFYGGEYIRKEYSYIDKRWQPSSNTNRTLFKDTLELPLTFNQNQVNSLLPKFVLDYSQVSFFIRGFDSASKFIGR